LHKLRDLLTREGIKWSERKEFSYTVRELRRFPLLGIGMGGGTLLNVGPEFGTTYDLSTGCPECGTGAVQTSPLMIGLSELPKRRPVCQTCLGHDLVGPSVAEALRAARVTGLELRQVHLYGNNEPLPWWQMISSFTLPKMDPRTRGILHENVRPAPCPMCSRDGHYDTTEQESEPTYSRADVDVNELPDFVNTWECFGKSVLKDGHPINIAQPLMFIKPKVMDFFRSLKIRGVGFGPVHFVD